jgi:hypothetical protein
LKQGELELIAAPGESQPLQFLCRLLHGDRAFLQPQVQERQASPRTRWQMGAGGNLAPQLFGRLGIVLELQATASQVGDLRLFCPAWIIVLHLIEVAVGGVRVRYAELGLCGQQA